MVVVVRINRNRGFEWWFDMAGEPVKTEVDFDEVKFVRVDRLPTSERLKLQEKNIYVGLVKFSIKENSPKEVIDVKQALELPSQIIAREYER